MIDAEGTRLAALYLAQLEEEAQRLPPDQAVEIVADIREHIAAATAGSGGEVRTREVLDRLGSPRTLVSEALDSAGGTPPTPPQGPLSDILGVVARRVVPSTRWSGRESGAIACLIAAELGAIVFPIALVAWLWGLNRLTTSRVWTSREKLLGGLTLGLGFPLAAIAAIVGVFSLQWSLFSFGVAQVCGLGNADPSFATGASSGAFGFDTPAQISVCHHTGSSAVHTVLITLAIIGAVLVIAQIAAVWKLLQARHRAPTSA